MGYRYEASEDLNLKELQEQARTWIYTRSDFKFRAPFDKRLAKRAGLIGESVSGTRVHQIRRKRYKNISGRVLDCVRSLVA